MTLAAVTLDQKYDRETGRIYLTGTQALVRLVLAQRRRDAAAGLNTAGYVSGYRGSPLGGLDRELWRIGDRLRDHRIHFQPGVNEDLAATAIWGTQQANLYPEAKYDGVFALWYGKGPGVDRSGDVFRHANMAGTSPHGGVLVVTGDDPAATASTVPSQSEPTLIDAQMPVLLPSNIGDVLNFGLFGWAMSRYSGCWVGLKTLGDIVDCSTSIEVAADRPRIVLPDDFQMPPDGLHIRLNDWPPSLQDARLQQFKLPAAQAFARANGLDQTVIDGPKRKIGIIAGGRTFLHVVQALEHLGLDDGHAADIGLSVYKVGMAWPLEPECIRAFANGLEEILVIEEKRPVIEPQLTALFYNMPQESRPRIVGKLDETGEVLLPASGALTVTDVAKAIARRLTGSYPLERLAERLDFLEGLTHYAGAVPQIKRLPYFCSGCPHNTSTRVPEGSRAAAGIGCHFMVTWMDRQSETFTQMGGEGANWNGMAPFTEIPHMFVNIGDGTYYHSGLLAIRAAIAAGVNVTYKILYNDAVAMTGGQPVDGPLDVPMMTRQMAGEGVKRIAVVSDEPEKYGPSSGLASGVTIHIRDDLDEVQREMREISGASVLIYDQTCAAEKRRRRKRGLYPDPPIRAFINEAVCEGCGDCGVVSNCVSIVPKETPFGLKRAIDQSSCNKDYSCLKGFCPSFVTVHGGTLRRRRVVIDDMDSALPEPSLPALDGPYGIVIAGIGGTGVVTLGALLGMAAHLEGKGISVVDQTGLAQKNGTVVSHLRIAAAPNDISALKISVGGARLLLGCDMVGAGGRDVLDTARHGVTRAVISAHQIMTADFTCNPDARFPGQALRDAISSACGDAATTFVEATKLATALVGDAMASNMLLVGFAYQNGLLPVSADAIERAIELNGAAVDVNTDAFRYGRRCANDPSLVERILGSEASPATVDDVIAQCAVALTEYQDKAYADRYMRLVDRVRRAEIERVPGETRLTEAVARSYFKILAYKDEYEVARLYADGRFEQRLREEFEGDFTVKFHLAPPLFAKKDPVTGHLRKRRYGPWVMAVFRRLAGFKRLRGTVFDVFGYTSERKMERMMIDDYEAMIAGLLGGLTRDNHRVACELASLPQTMRGFGHIKAANVQTAKTREAELLEAFHNRSPTASAAE